MLIEVEVQSLGKDPAKHPVVLLREKGGERLLPIWIGHSEASAIALHMAQEHLSRPLTHDLLLSTLEELGGRLERVAITHMRNNTYYAELLVGIDGETLTIDARPSDAIALAIRAGAPVLADDELLDRIRLEIADADEASSVTPATLPQSDLEGRVDPDEVGDSGGALGPPGRALSADELQRYLRSLNPEDFGRFHP